MSDAAVQEKTGKDWSSWFRTLDRWGARDQGHKATASWLQEEHDVSGWWAQTITVEYERARGLRAVGQTATGDHALSAQRTVAAPVDLVMDWWLDGSKRDAWLLDELVAPAVHLGIRAPKTSKTAMGEVLRFRVLPDGAPNEHKVEVTFTDLGDRTQVRLQHTAIAAQEERDALKTRWGPEMDRMKRTIEEITLGPT